MVLQTVCMFSLRPYHIGLSNENVLFFLKSICVFGFTYLQDQQPKDYATRSKDRHSRKITSKGFVLFEQLFGKRHLKSPNQDTRLFA